MAASADQMTAAFQGFSHLTLARQIGLIVGFAASVALAVSIALWAREPNYALLYANLAERDTAQVAEALNRASIPYRLDPASGGVMVAASKLHEARIQLAQQGLPRAAGFGFELMEKDQGLGTSRLVETARYHRALEGELARSISTLTSIESARVHLALPAQSVFVRDRRKPTASVLVNLFSGRALDETQVAGIVHLVASSIPDLEPESVTIVDGRGRLLTTPQAGAGGMAMSGQQLDYVRRLEETYVRRIIEIISPIVGAGAVQAQVSAKVDFSQVERTSESYDPEFSVLRSEQISEDVSGDAMSTGAPGALVNQPPAGGVIAPEAGAAAETTTSSGTKSTRSTRNFEVDRTVSHVREATGNVKRLSVAVVVDDRTQVNEAGEVERTPLTQEDLDRITTLVRDAVGFDAMRGDSLNVINASFKQEPVVDETVVEVPIWQQAWVYEVLKYLGAAIALAVLFFGVLRPVLSGLARQGERSGGGQMALPEGMTPEQMMMQHAQGPGMLAGPGSRGRTSEEFLNTARQMVQEDPKRVAQVMKTWVATDGG